jgi:integrase
MENGENEENGADKMIDEIIEEFGDFLRIDCGLREATIKEHLSNIRLFFKVVKKPLDQITARDIRDFLKQKYNSHSVKAVRVFFGRYLNRKDLVQTFKVPSSPFKPKIIPSKEELREFYEGIKSLKGKVIFLLLASSGLRYHEVMELKYEDIDLEKRMIRPRVENSTKRAWVSFFNEEAAELLREYMKSKKPGEPLFSNAKEPGKTKIFRGKSKITPKILREWFACEMGRLGVPDRYVDAFCGRVPRSVLARHYTDFSPEKLKEIYDKANLKVLS